MTGEGSGEGGGRHEGEGEGYERGKEVKNGEEEEYQRENRGEE